MVTRDEVMAALGQVMDPEIHRPITDLDMVKDVSIDDSGLVAVEVLLTVAGCPLKAEIQRRVTDAATALDGVDVVNLQYTVMTEAELHDGSTVRVGNTDLRLVLTPEGG